MLISQYLLLHQVWQEKYMYTKYNVQVYMYIYKGFPDTYLKLLQANTTPTMFFPISWTSPLTVASTITPEYPDSC